MKDEMNIVWVDLEMTGLDVENDQIIEMACIVTDKHLNVIETGLDIVIHQDQQTMENMNDWCKEHHGKSGLTKAVLESKTSLAACEKNMLEFIKKYTIKGKPCLAGASVHYDKLFLEKHMPNFMAHLDSEILDVSSIKELIRRWYPKQYAQMHYTKKQLPHRALDDIKYCIKILKKYRKRLFVPIESTNISLDGPITEEKAF